MRTNLIIIIIALFIIGGMVIYHKYRMSEMQNAHYSNLKKMNGETQEIINKYTKEISFQNQIIKSERKMSEEFFSPQLERISKELMVTKNNIKDMINLNYNAINSGKTKTIVIRDTINNTKDKYQFEWSDNFLSVNGLSTMDSTYIDYTYTDSIRLAGFVKKNGFIGLGKKEYLIDVKLGNSKAKVSKLQKVEFGNKEKSKYSLGVGAGYYYVPQLNKPYFGIGVTIHRNILNF